MTQCIPALRISTNEESYVFHIYHTARLFFGGVIEVETSLSAPDLTVLGVDGGIQISDGRITLRFAGTDKESCKRAVFRYLSQTTGTTPPWGTLIGVRPSKFATNGLEAGESDEAILSRFTDFYLASSEKAGLALAVAKRERTLLSRFKDGRIGLYLNLPFCPSRCSYCSFLSYPSKDKGKMAAYHKTLLHDIRKTGELLRRLGLSPGYLYFGGGTPTAPDEDAFAEILEAVQDHLIRDEQLTEYTVEAGRPDTITRAKLDQMKRAGVTRISINPQTFCDDTLVKLGRTHAGQEIETVFSWAREAGIASINMDLILGLPGEGVKEAAATARRVIALAPDNVTVHGLALKKGANLSRTADPLAGRVVPAMYRAVYGALEERGYEPYYLYRNKNTLANMENTGFTLPGHESRYNIAMIEETDTILAMGAAGITRVLTRQTNPNGLPLILRQNAYKDLDLYLGRIDEILKAKEEVLAKARELVR